MVKHIKKSYKKDGKLTDDEKSIAYATAWKDYNKDKVSEGASIIQGGTSRKKVSYRGPTAEKSKPKKSVSYRGEKDERIPRKNRHGVENKSARYGSQLHRLRPRSERLKVNEEELLEKRRKPYISIKTRVKKGIGREPLKDVNKPGEKKSMQSVGGFRGVHGASRKSKSAQGPAARVEYRRKSPADTPKSAAPKGTFYALQKRIKEDWKPEIEVIDTKARAKKAEKKRKEAASSLPPHLRLDAMKKAFAHTNEEKQITPMQDNNLFGNAYAGTPPPKKKKKLKEASFADYMAQAQAARERQQKKQDDRKKRDAEFVDRQKHGIKFYDKKGRGRIVKGKKVYDR